MNRRSSALGADSKEEISAAPRQQEILRSRQQGPSIEFADEAAEAGGGLFSQEKSKQAQLMRAEIKRVSRCPFNILITGETGTGKTYAAREIHRLSARTNKSFMELNCANLPEQLVEAELFGYRRGAFTGADRDHVGLFEEANGGILFLDEIGDLLPTVQNKLLRAIEEKQIKRLGTNRYINCDVQIISATSRNLSAMLERGEFREDLYCRLAVLSIETAPLRERREDIPAMIALFMREAAIKVYGKVEQSMRYQIDDEAVELLCRCEYLGNIRALRNLIYELTSYVSEDESISIELVRFVLLKLSSRRVNPVTHVVSEEAPDSPRSGVKLTSTIYAANLDPATQFAFLRSIACEGDIILPLELCVLRRGETFKEWTARAKFFSIQAARTATGGSLQSAAQRLGLTRNSLKGHLQRTKRSHNQSFLDWQDEAESNQS
ncbi:MAG TPA: sigma 54-interacting transcriptional regulator [Pyrinomonadaceae bacterium]